MKLTPLILLLLLSSCYSLKKAESQLDKANNKYPDETAAFLRNKYPCITTQADTTTVYQDSVVFLECPPLLDQSVDTTGAPLVSTPAKSLYKEKVNATRINPVKVQIKTVYVKERIEDSAKIYQYNRIAEDAVKETKEAIKVADGLVKNIDRKNKCLLILFILLGISVYINYKQFTK